MMIALHPALPLLLGAVLVLFSSTLIRQMVSVVAAIVAFYFVATLPTSAVISTAISGEELILLSANKLSIVFALAFSLFGVVASVFAWSETDRIAKCASLFLVAGGVGVSLAGDWITLFLFWEMLTISSLLLIWAGKTEESFAAGHRYLMLHLFGGVCLLSGVLLNYRSSHSFELAALDLNSENVANWLILVGLMTNAAVVPLHAWIADAYPRASIYGTVFLSAFTSKGAVYVLARIFPGTDILLYFGAAMVLFGTLYALLANDIRRLLVYSIISQIGYMVAAIGLGTSLAINGTAAHAFSHIFYKGLLLMAAGAVIYATGRGKLTELGGLAKPLALVLVFYVIGALSIAGAPFFSGFVSKSMIVSAVEYQKVGWLEIVLLFASTGTILHSCLRLPYFVFFGKQAAQSITRQVPRSMYLGMSLAAVVCLYTGIKPDLLYSYLPFADVPYHPFTAEHVAHALEVLAAAVLIFGLLRRWLVGRDLVVPDLDCLYRKPLSLLLECVTSRLVRVSGVASNSIEQLVERFWNALTVFKIKELEFSTASLQAMTIFVVFGVIALLAFAI